MIEDFLPYVIAFSAPLVATLLLTPLVRGINRRLGMVDKPDPRRINKVPIPRGGGLAVVIGLFVPYVAFCHFTGRPLQQGVTDVLFWKMVALSVATALVGLADDRFSLNPKLKLACQVVLATLVWWWADLGFGDLWPCLPPWLDCFLTVFWIVGAINAFNLIDGLDGLAAGIALIATVGMAGTVFFTRNPQATLFYCAFAGALLGFLRYNYNPASVFLGDCGSMFIGFVIGTMPLMGHTPNSFLVSVGVPMLAMGVPIFDTALAILRRSVRHLLRRGGGNSGKVMSADTDHLHHRILRATGLNQRKTAWILYGLSIAFVAIGFAGMLLQSRAAGFWLVAVAFAAVVIFKDSTIELFDVGLLLTGAAHSENRSVRRRLAMLSLPIYVAVDVAILFASFLICCWTLGMDVEYRTVRTYLAVRVVTAFAALAFFSAYRTVWSRAQVSNFVRLFLACVSGSIVGSVIIYYWPSLTYDHVWTMTLSYSLVSFVLLVTVRLARGIIRDLFYALDCRRLKARKDVSRVLVYGAGLRYRAFRRELVRTTAANDRMIVGIIDDNLCLKGRYIGGIRIYGTINEAAEIINQVNADAVVIACVMPDDWLKVVMEILRPTGVKVTMFSLSENVVVDG